MEKKFQSREELFSYLKQNKSLLIAEKKSSNKHCDSVATVTGLKVTTKAVSGSDDLGPDKIKVRSVINTTKIMDSHSDVHIDGIWTKTLKENKNIMLLQEHEMRFDKVISRDVNASTEMIPFSDLGVNAKGETQALIFTSVIERKQNEFMFNQYKSGYVDNHSVGMQYVKIDLAINSDDEEYKEENEVWNKYFPMIANPEKAIEQGYFWAVTEAKIIEGSAVLVGSNTVTPTLSVESKNIEPSQDTQNPEPSKDTPKQDKLNINKFL